ncbi:MAG: flavin reductase family protein [Clostridia bacterium]|nr:flavin reductase family protein [Clostridia bacterium]
MMLENAMQKIGKEWMLITARDEKNHRVNAMTASWGSLGVLWGKNICICFVRPQRHTYGLMEAEERLSIAFLTEDYRSALRLCGSKSGRDTDKLAEAGLSSVEIDGVPVIREADTVLLCRKLYADDLNKACFLDTALLSHYAAEDYHRFYVLEIEKAYRKETE